MGATPMDDPKLYFDASPINYATFANNQISVFLGVGTEDDLVERSTQTDAFLIRLKQAGFFARTCIVQGAPHYWVGDPIEARLLRLHGAAACGSSRSGCEWRLAAEGAVEPVHRMTKTVVSVREVDLR